MNRLTERFNNGQVGVYGCGNNCKYDFKYCHDHLKGCPTINEIYEKLAYYEDLEEADEPLKIYISGKITGTEDFIDRFRTVEEKLTAEGYLVFNPAHANSFMPKGTSYDEYMKVSFCLLDISDAIYMMHGWEDSKGAIRELHYAMAHKKKVYLEDTDISQDIEEYLYSL